MAATATTENPIRRHSQHRAERLLPASLQLLRDRGPQTMIEASNERQRRQNAEQTCMHVADKGTGGNTGNNNNKIVKASQLQQQANPPLPVSMELHPDRSPRAVVAMITLAKLCNPTRVPSRANLLPSQKALCDKKQSPAQWNSAQEMETKQELEPHKKRSRRDSGFEAGETKEVPRTPAT